jgi:hypothetical protein
MPSSSVENGSNGGDMPWPIRPELIRLLVLIEISDDYENVDQVILPHLI